MRTKQLITSKNHKKRTKTQTHILWTQPQMMSSSTKRQKIDSKSDMLDNKTNERFENRED